MSAFLMVIALAIAGAVLGQQIAILHRQNKQMAGYQSQYEEIWNALMVIKNSIANLDTAFTDHGFNTAVEAAEQSQYRKKYWKRKVKMEQELTTSGKVEFVCPICGKATSGDGLCIENRCHEKVAQNDRT